MATTAEAIASLLARQGLGAVQAKPAPSSRASPRRRRAPPGQLELGLRWQR
ncbi:MAG: hypothetical protein HY744_13025 [Deltaproteobacteria bacterium]|nr:hypothetical protein [Deltaproteobacteria bacterium]